MLEPSPTPSDYLDQIDLLLKTLGDLDGMRSQMESLSNNSGSAARTDGFQRLASTFEIVTAQLKAIQFPPGDLAQACRIICDELAPITKDISDSLRRGDFRKSIAALANLGTLVRRLGDARQRLQSWPRIVAVREDGTEVSHFVPHAGSGGTYSIPQLFFRPKSEPNLETALATPQNAGTAQIPAPDRVSNSSDKTKPGKPIISGEALKIVRQRLAARARRHDEQRAIERRIRALGWDVDKLVRDSRALERFRQQLVHWEARNHAPLQAYRKWFNIRCAHEQKVKNDPRLQDFDAGPPGPEWKFESLSCIKTNLQDPSPRTPPDRIWGWSPPEVANRPNSGYPLPIWKPEFESNRSGSYSLDEKYAVLSAIHDVYCSPQVPIDPWRVGTPSSEFGSRVKSPCQTYDGLLKEAGKLPIIEQLVHGENLPALQAFLDDVRNDLNQALTARVTETGCASKLM